MTEATLIVNAAQLQTIFAGLHELPFKVALPVINALNAQIQKQQDAEEKTTEKDDGVL